MAALAAKQSGISRRERRRVLMGLLFISPWLIGFLAFTIYPLGSSIWYSLTRFDLIRPAVFIGLGNFGEIFANDTEFKTVMYNTLYYVGLGSPLCVITAFLLAWLLNLKIKARSVFRAIFFFPAIVPAVVIAMVMAFLLNTQFGAINSTLQALGLPVIHFLSSPELAKPSMIGINMWGSGTAMVIFLATLQDVPASTTKPPLWMEPTAGTNSGLSPFRCARPSSSITWSWRSSGVSRTLPCPCC